MLKNIPQYKAEDVIAVEIEVKGSTEPFQLLLEPYAIIIPGESFISVNVRKTFKVCLLLTSLLSCALCHSIMGARSYQMVHVILVFLKYF